MPKLIYLQYIVHPDNSSTPVTVLIEPTGCTVDYLSTQIVVAWDQLPDVEYLSVQFEDVAVKAFKVIVRMLGKVHNDKPTYLELLK